jgi:hypothetical protein
MFTPFAFVKTTSAAGGGYDPDAQAFINATGISGTNADAINDLVLDLKSYSLWTQLKAFYPAIGGTSTSCKYNLINPADTDAAFRLTFNGGWTFDSAGMKPNGTNGWANTYFSAANDFPNATGASLFLYTPSTTATSGNRFFYVLENQGSPCWGLTNYDGSGAKADGWSFEDCRIAATPSPNNGIFIASRNGATDFVLYQDGASLGSNSGTAGSRPDAYITIGAFNEATTAGTPTVTAGWGDQQIGCIGIGIGLTSGEAGDLNTCIDNYITALGR